MGGSRRLGREARERLERGQAVALSDLTLRGSACFLKFQVASQSLVGVQEMLQGLRKGQTRGPRFVAGLLAGAFEQVANLTAPGVEPTLSRG